jgi:hypothetical protein
LKEIGPIDGSKPTVLQKKNTPFDFNLTVFDIPGAVSKPKQYQIR